MLGSELVGILINYSHGTMVSEVVDEVVVVVVVVVVRVREVAVFGSRCSEVYAFGTYRIHPLNNLIGSILEHLGIRFFQLLSISLCETFNF
jgi:hypothetical protein